MLNDGVQRRSDTVELLLLIKMVEITLIDLGYCKVESFLAFSMTGSSLESLIYKLGPHLSKSRES